MTFKPRNTSADDPLLHLAAMWPRPGSDGKQEISDYITGQEAAGQRQLVASEVLPSDCRSRTEMETLGFTFGAPLPDDPMFMPATLPDGWTKRGTDHSMWSIVVDERGIERVQIFYKAAFYDRKAHMSLVNVGGQLGMRALYGDGTPALPDQWGLLTDAERDEFAEYLRRHAAERRGQSWAEQDTVERADQLLALVAAAQTEGAS